MIGTYKNNNQSVVLNVGCGGNTHSSFGNMKKEADGSINTGLTWNDGATIYIKTISVESGVLQNMPADAKEIIWSGIGYPPSFFVKDTNTGAYEFVGSGDLLGNVTLVYTKVATNTSADENSGTLSGNF